MAGITESVARVRGATAGEFPVRRRVPVLLLSAAAGFLLSIVRPERFVDTSVVLLPAGFAGGRLSARPPAASGRREARNAVTSPVAGAFPFSYRDVRVLARREIPPGRPIAPRAT
ncbi:hypothetical protein GCM10027028_65910 [Streptomyces sundarbansensis]